VGCLSKDKGRTSLNEPIETMYQRPPITIFAAAGSLGLSIALGLITWVDTAKWQSPLVLVPMLVVLGLMFLYCRAICRGRSWARWLFLIGTALGLWVAPQTLAHFTSQLEQIR